MNSEKLANRRYLSRSKSCRCDPMSEYITDLAYVVSVALYNTIYQTEGISHFNLCRETSQWVMGTKQFSCSIAKELCEKPGKRSLDDSAADNCYKPVVLSGNFSNMLVKIRFWNGIFAHQFTEIRNGRVVSGHFFGPPVSFPTCQSLANRAAGPGDPSRFVGSIQTGISRRRRRVLPKTRRRTSAAHRKSVAPRPQPYAAP
jgi:hypothetical protein